MEDRTLAPADPVDLAVGEVMRQAGDGMPTAAAVDAVAAVSRHWMGTVEGSTTRQRAPDLLQELAGRLRIEAHGCSCHIQETALLAAAQAADLAALGSG